jgi:hypothetical protein
MTPKVNKKRERERERDSSGTTQTNRTKQQLDAFRTKNRLLKEHLMIQWISLIKEIHSRR